MKQQELDKRKLKKQILNIHLPAEDTHELNYYNRKKIESLNLDQNDLEKGSYLKGSEKIRIRRFDAYAA